MFFYIHAVAYIRHKRERDQNPLTLAWIFSQADLIEEKSGSNREQMVPFSTHTDGTVSNHGSCRVSVPPPSKMLQCLACMKTDKQILLWCIMQEVAAAHELKTNALLKPGIWFNAKTSKVLGQATWITSHSCFACFNYMFWNQINKGCFWVSTVLDENKKACHVIR